MEYERGKSLSGIRSGFEGCGGFTTGRGIIHALINSVRDRVYQENEIEREFIARRAKQTVL